MLGVALSCGFPSRCYFVRKLTVTKAREYKYARMRLFPSTQSQSRVMTPVSKNLAHSLTVYTHSLLQMSILDTVQLHRHPELIRLVDTSVGEDLETLVQVRVPNFALSMIEGHMQHIATLFIFSLLFPLQTTFMYVLHISCEYNSIVWLFSLVQPFLSKAIPHASPCIP